MDFHSACRHGFVRVAASLPHHARGLSSQRRVGVAVGAPVTTTCRARRIFRVDAVRLLRSSTLCCRMPCWRRSRMHCSTSWWRRRADACARRRAPWRYRHRMLNTAVVIHRGWVLGVAPKSCLPTYREFYERCHPDGGRGCAVRSSWSARWSQLGSPRGDGRLSRDRR
jgi:hypothetical protein